MIEIPGIELLKILNFSGAMKKYTPKKEFMKIVDNTANVLVILIINCVFTFDVVQL